MVTVVYYRHLLHESKLDRKYLHIDQLNGFESLIGKQSISEHEKQKDKMKASYKKSCYMIDSNPIADLRQTYVDIRNEEFEIDFQVSMMNRGII